MRIQREQIVTEMYNMERLTFKLKLQESLWKDTEENGQCIYQNREKRDKYVKEECVSAYM